MQKLFLILLINLITTSLISQKCGFSGGEIIRPIKTMPSARTKSILNIPVVIHIIEKENPKIKISDQMVYDQIYALNRDFNKLNYEWELLPERVKDLATSADIHFFLAPIDPSGNPTTGITRTITSSDEILIGQKLHSTVDGGKDPWSNEQYLNIWVTDLHDRLFGFGSPPSSIGQLTDGVVINSNVFGIQSTNNFTSLGRTLVHEVGHYLGLLHPWGDISGECEEDDGITDTPMQKAPHSYCLPLENQACFSSEPTYWNFMDYTPDCCMALFTQGQVEVMRHVLEEIRFSLIEHGASLVNYVSTNPSSSFIHIYPNPATAFFSVKWSENDQIAMLNIRNSNGILILQKNINEDQYRMEICTENLPKGVLFLSLFDRDGNLKVTQKVITQ